MARRLFLCRLTGLGVAAVLTSAARAHHGWSWAESEPMTLSGTVAKVQIAPPHPWLDIETDDGIWRVELGNPSQTQRAGFDEHSAKPGDAFTALGNRARDSGEKRMKAVQVTVGGKTYDIYPTRIPKQP